MQVPLPDSGFYQVWPGAGPELFFLLKAEVVNQWSLSRIQFKVIACLAHTFKKIKLN